jgi:signal transduction histidine kinase
MLRSLRFRLPALFLAGIVAAGIVSVAIAFQLLSSYSRSQSLKELRREAAGLSTLLGKQAIEAFQNNTPPAFIEPPQLEQATGDRIYYFGVPLFPGQITGLRVLPRTARLKINAARIRSGHTQTLSFTPPGNRPLIAVAGPLTVGNRTFGVLVIAKPQTELRDTWVTLMKFFGVSILGGLLVAGILAWYASRRIAKPVLGLSRAADEISRGRYDVPVPQVRGGGEISHLADRFREMAARLGEAEERERNFLMTVSHELRTPLTAIRGHVEAMREGLTDDPEAEEASLEVVAAAAARLERLVGDVLDLAKLDAHRFTVLHEEVDMARLLDQAYATFGEEARRRSIDYRCDIGAKPVILTDGDRVLQIISNLLSNAFRWTPDGGRVELGLSASNGAVSVVVGDTGPGIRPEERERIFRPFFSLDHSRDGGGGTGLGLAIARELALALGGRIELDTTPGKGSRFELILPATPAV